MKTRKIMLTRTAVVEGRHYFPDPDIVREFAADIVDELVDKNAGEPVMDMAATRPEQEPYVPDPDMQPALVEAARQALAQGDTVKTGAPSVAAMEKILGTDISTNDRAWAWDVIQSETETETETGSGPDAGTE